MYQKYFSPNRHLVLRSMTLLQVTSWHFLHENIHFRPAFLQEHLELHGPLQSHLMIFKISGGPASMSVIIGEYYPLLIFHPQLSGSILSSLNCLQTFIR